MHVITATQVQRKMTVSAGKKTFKNLRLDNYRYSISLKLADYMMILRPFILIEN